MKLFTRLSLFALLISGTTSAQDWLGFDNSNYAGVTGLNLQPASIVDSRYKVDVNLIGMNFMFGNNYLGLKRTALATETDANGNKVMLAFEDDDFIHNYMTERSGDYTKSVFVNLRIAGPGAMVTLNRKSAIALTWDTRFFLNVDGLQPELALQIKESLKYQQYWGQKFTNKGPMDVQLMLWKELKATYGRVLVDNNEHFLKGAISLKALQGVDAAYMHIENLQYQWFRQDSVGFFSVDARYGHNKDFSLDPSTLQKDLLSFNSFSSHLAEPGMDIGFVYEWRPDYMESKYDMDGETGLWRRDLNKYKLKLGISVLDIGAIRFAKGPYSHNISGTTANWNTSDLEFGTAETGVANFDDTIRARFTLTDADNTFSMNLPTALSIQADYLLGDGVYINFTPYLAFQFKNNENKIHDITTFSLTPRWENKWFGLYIPFSYDMQKNFGWGANIRLGPIVFGTRNVLTLIGDKDIYGAEFHFMTKVPIPYNKVMDRDNDHVSNKKDVCIDVPGVWEFLGCPDRDGDHIEDKVDACPDDPGLKEFNGCPDRDGDKIIDKEDACPDSAGLAEFKGCPDRDGDKIIDKEDDCPDEPGLPEFKGCPDKDGDGIIDKLDLCPTKPGPKENNGCPYTKLHLIDAQGNIVKSAIMDKATKTFTFDNLPADNIAVFKIEGEETDGLTFVNVIVNGSTKKANRGADKLFRFDYLKPLETIITLTKEEEQILKKAFDNLEFATGKDIIKPTSFSALDELAALMQKKPVWRLKISGHTDNQGAPAANMKLSQKRSEALKKYLIKKGVDPKRFVVKWYGQTQPIADNKTVDGRQKNRRVEMLIIE